jgi:hypothetical protein
MLSAINGESQKKFFAPGVIMVIVVVPYILALKY